MQSYSKFFVIFTILCLISSGFAQEDAAMTGGSEEEIAPSFPYFAEITGDNVNIRSGPGTNFYRCGKLNKGDRVKVISRQFSWARIVPPAGSFSWISMQYVNIDPKNPNIGIVTGDRVRVYAGSDFVKPLYSTYMQGKLDKGDKVTLLGEQLDDYYKIEPPPFAYLWIISNFIKPVKIVETTPPPQPAVEKPAVEKPADEQPAGDKPVVEQPMETKETVEEIIESLSPEELLERYKALQERVEAERAKPVGQQDYSDIKKALTKIAGAKDAGKASRYAEYLVKQLEGFELALVVAKEIKLQDEQLVKIKERIEKAHATRLEEFQDLGKYAVVGKLQAFTTYGPGHYRIVDAFGKTICYALPTGQASGMDLSTLMDKKVGLMGTVEPRPQAPPRVLVRFSEIVEVR
jgi:uncharacterized protein YgiM (DUF1202 family)